MDEEPLKQRAARLIRRMAKKPSYQYPSGEPNCTKLANYAAEALEIDPDEYHWIWNLAIDTAYSDT